MALADSLRKVANKAIGKFGGEITIQFISFGPYNTTTGTAVESITTENVKGVLEDVNSSDVNDLVRGDDKKLTVAASGLAKAPSLEDRIVINGVTHQIVRVQKVVQQLENFCNKPFD